jgi:hypothetical protein
MITQLDPPLPLETSKGSGLAHFVIDYGPEADLVWVVFMDKDGACWSVPNPEVRMSLNWTMGPAKTTRHARPPASTAYSRARPNKWLSLRSRFSDSTAASRAASPAKRRRPMC